MFDLLLFQSAVVEFGGRSDGFRRGLFRCGFLGCNRLYLLFFYGCLRVLRAGFRGCGEQKERGKREKRLNRTRPRFGDTEEEDEKDDRGSERICGPFDGPERGDGVFAFLPVEHPDARFKFVDAAVCGGRADIEAAGAAGEFGQLRFVERAFDRVSVAVRKDTEFAVLILHADDRGIRRIADADGEDRDLSFCEIADDGCPAPGQFVAVRHEDDGLVRTLCAFECLDRVLKRELHIRAADRDRVGVEIVHKLNEARPVHRQRTDQKGFARERDESETVARILLDDFAHEPFRMVHAARLHVVGEHAFRNVEQHEQIPSGRGVLHDLFTPGRAGGGDGQEKHGKREQDDAEDAFA